MTLCGIDAAEFEAVGAEDVLRFATPVGVSLEGISRRCDPDSRVTGDRPGVFAADPDRRATRLGISFAAALEESPGARVVVPVLPTPGDAMRSRVAPENLEVLAGTEHAAVVEGTAPFTEVRSPNLAVLAAWPRAHDRHPDPAECTPGDDPVCWVAHGEAVRVEAATLAELTDAFGYRERPEALCPPLLAPPPPGVPADVVAELLADIDAALAGVVAFAPDLVAAAR